MMENIQQLTQSARHRLMPGRDGNSAPKISYSVTVTTGSMKYAGTDSNVYIAITGASGEKTSMIKLDKPFHDDFERGSVDKFKVKLEDIGRPIILTIKHDEVGMFADWYAVSVLVQKSGDTEAHWFPVNQWISGTIQVSIGNAKLPQSEENPILMSFRKEEIINQKRNIKWRSKESEKAEGLPGYIMADSIDDLPRNLRLEDGMTKDFEDAKKIGKGNFVEKFHDAFDKLENISEIKNMFVHSKEQKLPEFQKNSERDEEFGRQMLNGCNPLILKRCEELPKNFPVTHQMVAAQLTRGVALEQEIKNGNIYIIDLKILERLRCGRSPIDHSAYFSCAPLCLFYQNNRKNLVPIAIQLWQQPGPNNLIWTPDDSDCDWLLAKTYFRNAEANVQLIVEKVFHCHLVLEPFSVGLYRCLSSNHPIRKLLLPHLRYVCATNLAIRSTLLNPGGALDKLLSYGGGSVHHLLRGTFKSFTFEQLNIRKVLTANGTLTANLPEYLFRNDALALWDCIEKFVGKIIGVFYKSNEDVKQDVEIQDWLEEIRQDGFRWEDGKDRGIPEFLSSIQQVIDFVTSIIFTSTGRHAAVTNSLFGIYANVTNAPLHMSLPPPTEKKKATHDIVVQSLPNKPLSCLQISVCHTLSKANAEQAYLVDYPNQSFCKDRAQKAIVRFKDELTKLSTTIRARNEGLTIPYDYLLPEKIQVASSL